MECDLCGNIDPPLQRVNGWSVCVPCASNGVLKEAMSASATLRKLRNDVRSRTELAAGATGRLEIAERRIDDAKHELDQAIRVLAVAIRESSVSGREAADAVKALDEFESTHDPKGMLRKRDDG